jgi:hypothetical protein
MFKSPELIALLKQLVSLPQREHEGDGEGEGEEDENDQEQTAEETRIIIYHVNIYIIIQRSFEKIHTLTSVFIATFFAYYYYLHFIRRSIQSFYILINMITIFYVIYYGLS